MALIGLHDAEYDYKPKKTFPNLALMRISTYHKNRGDKVEWWDKDKKNYDLVYSSKTFGFTPENPHLPKTGIKKGGTGYGLFNELPDRISVCKPDYTIYPACDYAIGFLTRGCPNNCSWCVVPIKERKLRPCANWKMLVRKDSNKLVLMDNNILACDYGVRQLAELSQTDYRLDLNQGMDVTLINEDICRILAKIKWVKYIRFSCDSEYKLPYFERMAELFREYGVSLSRVFVYILVQSDLEAADRRVQGLHRIYKNFNLYAQAERNEGITPSRLQLEFAQRYVYGKSYKKETWQKYIERLGLK
jgi:hypothetical protein